MSQKTSEQKILRKYEISRTLGTGRYGNVFEAKHPSENTKVAIKIIKSPKKSTEGNMMDLLRHDFILKKLKSFSSTIVVEGTKYFEEILVLEYFPRNLSTYVAKKLSNSVNKIKKIKLIMWQILQGVSYMHSKNIAHCDLKPRNILINEDLIVKICDFGMARKLTFNRKQSLRILTPGYQAPEILLNYEYYDLSIDIWSIGCILTHLCTGTSLISNVSSESEQLRCTFDICGPFSLRFLKKVASSQSNDVIVITQQPSCERSLRKYLAQFLDDEVVIDLIDSMLKMDPNDRVTAEQALSNDFFEHIADFV